MNEKNTPSLVRLKRVHYFLDKDPNFSARLKAAPIKHFQKEVKDAAAEGGKKIENTPFSQLVWDVAQGVMDAGFDAAALDRTGTIAWAKHVLDGGPKPSDQPAELAAEPAPVKTAPLTPAAAKVAGLETEIPIRVAIMTQLIAALQLSESFDRKPGADKLREKIAAAFDECILSVNARPVQPT